jgi:outer membrane protein OmpA-like peptidoglycan-associated protein
MSHINHHILFILFFIPVFTWGQDFSQRGQDIDTVAYYTKVGDQLFEEGKYYAAADYYGKALIKEETPYLMHQVAEANRQGRFYNFAELWYGELAEKYPEEYPLTNYWYGMMLKANGGKYQQAIDAFESFLDDFEEKAKTYEEYSYYIKNASKEIKDCEYALKKNQETPDYRVYNIGNNINKKESEFGAVHRNDSTLLFTGANTVTIHRVKKFLFLKTKETYDTMLRTRLFKSIKRGEFWKERSIIYMPLNDRNFDIGTPSPSPIEDAFYLTMCQGSFGKKQCHIYKARSPSLGKWMKPQKLSSVINPDKASAKNPCITIDSNGDTLLYFSSDRKKGVGGFDIWVSQLKNGTFQEPVNLGEKINTPKDEVSPFYDQEKEALYFSSDGHYSLGEYDVFEALGNARSGFDTAKNVGPPVNSPTDDYYFSQYHQNGKVVGYLSSNRTGGFSEQGTCCDDIYFFERSEQDKFLVKGHLTDKTTGQPITTANIKAYKASKENVLNEQSLQNKMQFQLSIEQNGEQAQLHITAPDYQPKNIVLSEHLNKMRKDTLDLQKVELSPVTSTTELPTIHYSFGNAQLTAKSKEKLDQITKTIEQHPQQQLIIASHTDNIDNKQFNIRLSKQRTQNVIQYLTEQGIDNSRLIGQWHGEFNPIAANQTSAGKDNPEGRAKNRRTEFQLTESAAGVKRGKIVPDEPTAKKKPATDLELSGMAYSTLLQKYGDRQADGLTFKVQIGAFQHPDPDKFKHLSQYGAFTSEKGTDGLTKFMIGETNTLTEAVELEKKLKQEIPDAWIVTYYQGERISLLKGVEKLAEQ